jgi:hypothetical protein
MAAVSVVALVAAVASYVHMYELADRAGEEWRATLVPLSVDGLLVAASMVLFVRRRDGEKAGVMPWIGIVLGLAASLGANVAAGWDGWEPPWLAGVVAAWPPVALAIAFELLISVTRRPSGQDERATAPRVAAVPPPEAAKAPEAAPTPQAPAEPRPVKQPAGKVAKVAKVALTVEEMAAQVRTWPADPEKPAVSSNSIRNAFGVGRPRANEVLERVRSGAGRPVLEHAGQGAA